MLLLHPLECRTLILKSVLRASGDKFFSREVEEKMLTRKSPVPLQCFPLLCKEGMGRGGGGDWVGILRWDGGIGIGIGWCNGSSLSSWEEMPMLQSAAWSLECLPAQIVNCKTFSSNSAAIPLLYGKRFNSTLISLTPGVLNIWTLKLLWLFKIVLW